MDGTTNRITRPTLNLDRIPHELRPLRQWVCWQYETRDGKPTKVPKQPTGENADSKDPDTWVDFETACNAAHRFSGVGFVFSPDDSFTGVDLDKCIDPESGEMAAWAKSILDRLNSYAEISPSGTGVKLFVKARKPGERCKQTKLPYPGAIAEAAVEVYDAGRYFTVTGARWDGYPATIEDRQEELEALYFGLFPPKVETRSLPAQPCEPLDLDDGEILEKARAAKNGAAFSRLWEGDTSDHAGDDSAADLALCCHLSFWCGPDPAKIDRLFRQSGLLREKWERQDYRERTITTALDVTREFYSPNGSKPQAQSVDWTARVEEIGDTEIGQRGDLLRRLYDDLARADAVTRQTVRDLLKAKKLTTVADFNAAMKESDERARRARQGQYTFTRTDGEELTPIADNGGETPYAVGGGRFWFLKRDRDGEIPVPLSDFTARIVEDVTKDDGVERTRLFVVEGESASGKPLPRAKVPAQSFDGLGWLSKEWGVDANVSPDWNAQGRVRYAMKLLSRDAERREVYAHLGWRQIGGKWAFLHAGGAVGVDEVEVDIDHEQMQAYRLPDATEDAREAVKRSIALLDIAPHSVTIPCLAASFRAVTESILPANFTLWLLGESGALKSTLTALFLAHFGATFDDRTLPANWLSTANELERLAFCAKDFVFVVDDFAPQPSRYESDQLESKAQRLIRSQGNRQGRQRMNRDRTSAPTYYPRGLVWVTGEQVLSGVSTMARILSLEVLKDSVNLDRLTEAQRNRGRLSHAMRGFVEWLQPQYESLTQTLPAAVEELRTRARQEGQHLRQPEIVAHLYAGLDLMLAYAVEIGACEASWADELRSEAWETLLTLTAAQNDRIRQQRPSRRFLSILRELFTQGKAYLKDVTTGSEPPDDPEGLGWRNMANPKEGAQWHAPGEHLGWADDEYLYLMHESAFRTVAKVCTEQGAPFPVKQQSLLKALVDEGQAVGEVEKRATGEVKRNTPQVWIGCASANMRVLQLHRESLSLG